MLIIGSALLALTLAANPPTEVTLDGEKVHVSFSDGDTFQVKSGKHSKARARLEGYNALESYGPVHRWGEWTAKELYALSKAATEHARKGPWTCTTRGPKDRYGRILVYCEDLALSLIAAGLGHVFAVEAAPAPALIAAQKKAVAEKRGMWRKGAPTGVITSLHSAAEEGEIYNRVASVADGMARKRPHKERYDTCSETCSEGSCMTYVPYELRYGGRRAHCLR